MYPVGSEVRRAGRPGAPKAAAGAVKGAKGEGKEGKGKGKKGEGKKGEGKNGEGKNGEAPKVVEAAEETKDKGKGSLATL